MAILKPDKVNIWNGLKVNEYLLTKHNPNGIDMPTVALPSTPLGVTVHNTGAISVSSNTTMAEQYTRATVNGNMNDVRVHFYVDDVCAWQNLPLTLSGWHAADGSGKGNRRTIAIEVIGNSKKAEANAVKLVAYLLNKYGLSVEKNLFTHTHWLNVRDGKRGTIDQLNVMYNSYKNCLPIDSTELLTSVGWKNLGEITKSDFIAQYDNGIISFVNPIDVVKPYRAKTLKTRYLEATENHRMLVKNYGSKGNYEDKLWGDVLSSITPCKMNTSGILDGELPISDDELLLLAWIQGNGHYIKNNNDDIIGIEFHLKKERKINRIHQILQELEINYHDNWCKNDTVHIKIYNKNLYKWAETWLENKEFSYKLLKMSKHQFDIFLEELFIINGRKNERQKMYISSSKKSLDFIQALCTTHGVRASQTTLGSSESFYGEQPICVNILKTDASFYKNNNIKERETIVSCVTVPSSYILIRQNNHVFVTGNCPIYIIPHWGTFKANVKESLVKLQGGKKDSPISSLYRVRKTWEDAKSQIGAFTVLENAKKACKNGYKIFDEDGKVVYSSGAVETPSNNNVNVYYKVFSNNRWGKEIVNSEDYAGIERSAIRGVIAKTSEGVLRYRVHINGGGWLGWISEYNEDDWINGCAGIKTRDIDAIQFDFQNNSNLKIKYRASTIGSSGYLDWVTGYNNVDSDGYAGIFGKPIDKIQIKITS